MDHDLRLLLDILAHTGDEVQGHESAQPLTPDNSALMDRLIDGKASAEERHTLAVFLKGKPLWIERIANRVKNNRQASATPAARN